MENLYLPLLKCLLLRLILILEFLNCILFAGFHMYTLMYMSEATGTNKVAELELIPDDVSVFFGRIALR